MKNIPLVKLSDYAVLELKKTIQHLPLFIVEIESKSDENMAYTEYTLSYDNPDNQIGSICVLMFKFRSGKTTMDYMLDLPIVNETMMEESESDFIKRASCYIKEVC